MNRKPGRLSARWSKSEEDWLFSYPRGCDGHLICGSWQGYITWPEFLKELELRGYDLTTATFTVDAKPKPAGEGEDRMSGGEK